MLSVEVAALDGKEGTSGVISDFRSATFGGIEYEVTYGDSTASWFSPIDLVGRIDWSGSADSAPGGSESGDGEKGMASRGSWDTGGMGTLKVSKEGKTQ